MLLQKINITLYCVIRFKKPIGVTQDNIHANSAWAGTCHIDRKNGERKIIHLSMRARSRHTK